MYCHLSKKLTFLADMSAKEGGAKPLSAKNLSFLDGSPKIAMFFYDVLPFELCSMTEWLDG